MLTEENGQSHGTNGVYASSCMTTEKLSHSMIAAVFLFHLKGLFIGKKLDPSKDYAVPVELQRLMRFFHSHEKPASFDATLLNLDTPV